MIKFYFLILFLLISFTTYSQKIKETNQDNSYYINQLERKIEILTDSLSKNVVSNSKQKKIIKLFIGHTVFVSGVVLITVTGLVVPVLMGVCAIEVFLIIQDNYSQKSGLN